MLNVITVKTGTRYAPEYANKMLSMVKRHLHVPFKFLCITDNPAGLDEEICPLTPEGLTQSWWDKLQLFRPEVPLGDVLYLDLDQILVDDITPIVLECLKHPFSCYADHIEYCGVKLGSAFMTFKSRSLTHIWDDFKANQADIMQEYAKGGDQVYLSQHLNDVFYFDEHFPGAVQSYKWGYLKDGLKPESRIINFHGMPKMADVRLSKLAKEHWR